MSKERPISHEFEGEGLESVFVGRRDGEARPTVILIPTVMGVSDLEIGFGRQLVELGYNALGRRPVRQGIPRRAARRHVRRDDPPEERPRRAAPPAAARARGRAGPRRSVPENQIVVAGYCFGGQCALDLARSGADIAAAVSFHGLFDPPGLPPQKIKAKVVAFHGWDDPMVHARQGRRLGPGADRGRLRLADPRLWPRRPRLHQPARERAADRRRRLQRARRRAAAGPASSTCSRNCSVALSRLRERG